MAPRRRHNQVLSASRRTELLAHYPDLFAQRLEEIGPESVHSVVIWTKDATNLRRHARLQAALARVGQVFLHWTVTGLGGSFLEPNVPPPAAQMALLSEVVAAVGDPRRIHWRYDPLIAATREGERLCNIDPDAFQALAERFAEAGIPAVHVSFVTPYPKVVRRLARLGITLEVPTAEEQVEFLQGMAHIAADLGMALLTCSQPGFPRQRCIDGELLTALHPRGERCRTERAAGQRELCGCTVSLDIGRYLACPNGCAYCYASPARR